MISMDVRAGGRCLLLFDLLCRLGRISAAHRRLAQIGERVLSGAGRREEMSRRRFQAPLAHQPHFFFFFLFRCVPTEVSRDATAESCQRRACLSIRDVFDVGAARAAPTGFASAAD